MEHTLTQPRVDARGKSKATVHDRTSTKESQNQITGRSMGEGRTRTTPFGATQLKLTRDTNLTCGGCEETRPLLKMTTTRHR
jgi:hypothetical protein